MLLPSVTSSATAAVTVVTLLPWGRVVVNALAGVILSPQVTTVLVRLAILAPTVGLVLLRLFVSRLGVPSRPLLTPSASPSATALRGRFSRSELLRLLEVL